MGFVGVAILLSVPLSERESAQVKVCVKMCSPPYGQRQKETNSVMPTRGKYASLFVKASFTLVRMNLKCGTRFCSAGNWKEHYLVSATKTF